MSKEILVFDPNYINHLQSLRYREIMEPRSLRFLKDGKWVAFNKGVRIRRGFLKSLPKDIQERLSK